MMNHQRPSKKLRMQNKHKYAGRKQEWYYMDVLISTPGTEWEENRHHDWADVNITKDVHFRSEYKNTENMVK